MASHRSDHTPADLLRRSAERRHEPAERVTWSVMLFTGATGAATVRQYPATNTQHGAAMLAAELREQYSGFAVAVCRTTEQRAWADGTAGRELFPEGSA